MAFTEQGLLEQRNDFIEDITSIEILGHEGQTLYAVPRHQINVGDESENPVVLSFVITGENVGLGNSVNSYKILKDDMVLYSNSFSVVNTCVTLQDTFTFTITVGN